MLSDLERKLLTIIRNNLHTKSKIDLKKLCLWTGRNEKIIIKTLNELKEKNFIEWDGNLESIKILYFY